MFEAAELTRAKMGALVAKGGPTLTAALRTRIGDGRVHVRRNAALGLRLTDPLEQPTIGALQIARKDEDSKVRSYAVEAFASGGVDGHIAIPVLIDALNDDAEEVSQPAIQGLLAVLKKARSAELYKLTIQQLDNASIATTLTVTEVFLKLGKPAIVTLTATLAHSNGVLSRWARGTLREFGRPAVDTLIEALKRPALRAPAAHVLETMTDFEHRHITVLGELIGGPDPEVQTAAFRVLTAVRKILDRAKQRPASVAHPEFYTRSLTLEELQGATEGVTAEALHWNLRDGRWFVRTNSLLLMSLVGVEPDHAEATLLAVTPLLKDASKSVRKVVLNVLPGLFGPNALGLLAETSRDRDPEIAALATRQLLRLSSKALPGLLRLASDPGATAINPAIVKALSSVGKAALGPTSRLAVEGPTHIGRATALAVLATGKPGGAVRKIMLSALRDDHERVRQTAAEALGRAFVGDAAVVKALMMAARAESVPAVRRALSVAADRVAGRGPRPTVLAPAPMPVPGFDGKHLSAKELARVAKPSALSGLKLLFSDGRPMVRYNVAAALATAATADDEDVLRWLLLSLKDADAHVRRAAASSLGQLRPDARLVLPALRDALEFGDEALDAAILEAMFRYDERALGPVLSRLNKREVLTARELNLVAAAIPAPLACSLANYLHRPMAAKVRQIAAALLAAIGPDASGATDDLQRALKDPISRVRATAARALGRVADPTVKTYGALLVAGHNDSRASVKGAVQRGLDDLLARLDPEILEKAGGPDGQRRAWLKQLRARTRSA